MDTWHTTYRDTKALLDTDNASPLVSRRQTALDDSKQMRVFQRSMYTFLVIQLLVHYSGVSTQYRIDE